MKKRWIILAIFALIAILVSVAAYSWFTDQETSADNVISAGTLNLTVGGQEGGNVAHLSFSNVVPAIQWQGAEYDYQWVIKNTGTIPGRVSYKITNVRNLENGINTPEALAGDTTEDVGELGSQYKLLFQLNQPPWGYNQEMYPLNNFEDVLFSPGVYDLAPGESKNVFLRSWLINALDNNLVQGDSVEFDVVFYLEQVH